jgi:hypothetical protein
MRRRITDEELYDRVTSRPLNNESDLLQIMKSLRVLEVEFSRDANFILKCIDGHFDGETRIAIILEYAFRYRDDSRVAVDASELGLLSTENIRIYLNKCYEIGLTEKNQIRKRFEWYCQGVNMENKVITKTIRAFCKR